MRSRSPQLTFADLELQFQGVHLDRWAVSQGSCWHCG